MTPCRFGMGCTAPNCRFYHDDDEEFSPEEEERIDEILDMIEQEQRAREGGLGAGDEEDDQNLDEIFAYIQNQNQNQQQASQPPNNQPPTDDFSLPEGADDEYESMIQQSDYYGTYPLIFLPFSPPLPRLLPSPLPFLPHPPLSPFIHHRNGKAPTKLSLVVCNVETGWDLR